MDRFFLFSICLAMSLPFYVQTEELDSQLLLSLKSAASHDQNRKIEFHQDRDAKKVFSNEREKGLAGFLEEQERWDLVRERGLAEHRKQKKTSSPQENSPEYREDVKIKKNESEKMETARLLVVKTREQIAMRASPTAGADELDELNLVPQRPRFDFRKRGSNKWTKKTPGGDSNPGKANSGTGGFAAPPPAFDDYPIQNDYLPATNPIDGFEEIPPPPPPPIDFEGAAAGIYNGNIDAGFGEAPPQPPPPPYNFN